MKFAVAIDVQNDFIDGSLGCDKNREITGKIVEAINGGRFNDHTLFATMDTHYANYLETKEGEKLPVEHCVYLTEGWKLADGLKDKVDPNNVILKGTFGSGALVQTIGNEVTKRMSENSSPEEKVEIELFGFCLSICVISNALLLKAAFPNADIRVIGNLCGDVDEESRQAAIKVLKNCQIDFI